MKHFSIFLVFFFLLKYGCAQDSAAKIQVKYLDQVSEKANSVSDKLNSKSGKVLKAFERQEEKIYRKLWKRDSSKAKQFLSESTRKYNQLRSRLAGEKAKLPGYIPNLDTLKSSLNFLDQNRGVLQTSADVNKKLSTAAESVSELEGSFAEAEIIKCFLKERRRVINSYIAGLPFANQLKYINKEVYYYSLQIKEYKELLKDKKKVERKAIAILVKSKPFKDFMRKNSQLASMFRLPNAEEELTSESLQGLQTRTQVSALIQDRIQAGGANSSDVFRGNIEDGKNQLAALKDNLNQFLPQSTEKEAPDGFKANTMKTKPFLKRLELSYNIQNQKATQYFPITSDLAASLGYKLNDNGSAGIGVSYKVGWGTGWNNLRLSHQGVGFRSYFQYRIKGNVHISGGYEQNYRGIIRSVQQFQAHSGWYSSGLVGLTKSYRIDKKLKGNAQILWDFMSYTQTPKTQPIVFRIAYKLK